MKADLEGAVAKEGDAVAAYEELMTAKKKAKIAELFKAHWMLFEQIMSSPRFAVWAANMHLHG